MAPVPEPVLETFLTLLSDVDDTVRANTARAFGLCGVRSEPIFAALETRLDDSNAVTRFRAAEALARLGGPDATNRTPRLLEVITEAEGWPTPYFKLIAFNARTALGQAELGNEQMIKTFQTLLTFTASYERSEAIDSLTFHCRTDATPLLPAIRTLLVSAQQDSNGLIRQKAMHLLGEYP
jgi:HEAT repeat protein